MIKEIETTDTFGNVTMHIIIDHENEQFTSMSKAEYDRRQTEQVENLTEIIPADEA